MYTSVNAQVNTQVDDIANLWNKLSFPQIHIYHRQIYCSIDRFHELCIIGVYARHVASRDKILIVFL